MKTALIIKIFLRLAVFFASIVLICSCQKTLKQEDGPVADHEVTIRFKAVVDAAPLVLGNTCQNPFSENYSVRNFKFYFCQVDLLNTDSAKIYRLNKDEYFLIDFSDSNSTNVKLRTVPFKYNRISFLLGVDSARNVSGAQTGALDPARGMFWTWNSGYIMAKLEGNSPASSQPNQVFEYHIGGFSGPDNVLRRINLSFPSGQEFNFQSGGSTQMVITANANAWFSDPSNITIANTPVCTTPGPLAKQIAENYSKMFNVINIVSQ